MKYGMRGFKVESKNGERAGLRGTEGPSPGQSSHVPQIEQEERLEGERGRTRARGFAQIITRCVAVPVPLFTHPLTHIASLQPLPRPTPNRHTFYNLCLAWLVARCSLPPIHAPAQGPPPPRAASDLVLHAAHRLRHRRRCSARRRRGGRGGRGGWDVAAAGLAVAAGGGGEEAEQGRDGRHEGVQHEEPQPRERGTHPPRALHALCCDHFAALREEKVLGPPLRPQLGVGGAARHAQLHRVVEDLDHAVRILVDIALHGGAGAQVVHPVTVARVRAKGLAAADPRGHHARVRVDAGLHLLVVVQQALRLDRPHQASLVAEHEDTLTRGLRGVELPAEPAELHRTHAAAAVAPPPRNALESGQRVGRVGRVRVLLLHQPERRRMRLRVGRVREQRHVVRIEHEHAPALGRREGVVGLLALAAGHECGAQLRRAKAAQVGLTRYEMPRLAHTPPSLLVKRVQCRPLSLGLRVLGGKRVSQMRDEREPRAALVPGLHRALQHLE
eukprot:scaffold16223_cov66-Phaeocystis_antarctica.AAC.5